MQSPDAGWLLRCVPGSAVLVASVALLGCTAGGVALERRFPLRPESLPYQATPLGSPRLPSLASLIATVAPTPTLTTTRVPTRTPRPTATLAPTRTPLPPLPTRTSTPRPLEGSREPPTPVVPAMPIGECESALTHPDGAC